MIEITEATYFETVSTGKPLIMMVTAEWCSPCRSLKPTIYKLEEEYKNKLLFSFIDSDKYYDICATLHIQAIPTLLFIKDSQVKSNLVGVSPENKIREYIEELIK
jgi:thioredoxin-like negative regulator of GroEL